LPLVASAQFSPEDLARITAAVTRVLFSPQTAKCRERLRIHGFSKLTPDDYEIILKLETQAAEAGYPRLV